MGGARLTSLRSSAAAAAAVVSTAVALRLAGPPLAAEIPRLCGALATWLAPPYLYLLINAIILSIAASSHFANTTTSNSGEAGPSPPPLSAPILVQTAPYAQELEVAAVEDEDDAGGFVISRSSWAPERREEAAPAAGEFGPAAAEAAERPLVLERFGNRRSVRASPEGSGKALRRVSGRPKRNDTLESTWRTITEGRAVPLARRHLKKSETFDTRPGTPPPTEHNAVVMSKSETFNNAMPSSPAAAASPGSGRLRREASLGNDELNRRVEAFIRKFNEEMRLQRQESFRQYSEMMNRGQH